MNLYIEYESATLKALGLTELPECDSVILKHGEPETVLASTIRSNPLGEGWLVDLESPGSRIVSWTGTLAGDLFESHPMNWMSPGKNAFASFCSEIVPQLLRHEKHLCFVPHCRHVLSDPQSCVAFLKEQEDTKGAMDGGGPFEIALAPAEIFEPVMLGDIEDHLRRAFDALGEKCSMVMLRDVEVDEQADGEAGACRCVPLGRGLMPRELVRELLRERVAEDTPIVIGAEDLPGQLAWLGL